MGGGGGGGHVTTCGQVGQVGGGGVGGHVTTGERSGWNNFRRECLKINYIHNIFWLLYYLHS